MYVGVSEHVISMDKLAIKQVYANIKGTIHKPFMSIILIGLTRRLVINGGRGCGTARRG